MSRHQREVHRRSPQRAFSLVELVIVVTIIGILASIAIPRMTTASSSAKANALQATLANVRKAIDVYYAEHNRYPGYNPASGTPDGDFFVQQLILYTNFKGETSATRVGGYLYGPYLRSPFPKDPFHNLATVHVKATPADADPANGSTGWVAVLSHGFFGINASDTDLGTIGLDKPRDVLMMRGGPGISN
jgi:prepilin-type N-terminal cleavage/methylation domain-containing protein